MKKSVIALLLAAAVLLSCAACAGDTGVDRVPELTLEYYMAKADAVTVTDTHVIFTDDTGRGEMAVAKHPGKVSVLYASLACLFYEAGGKAFHLIGGTSARELYQQQIGRDITQDADVKVVATSANAKNWDVERILADQPDLILCAMSMSGYATISQAARQAGIQVIGIRYDTVQDYLKWFKVFCHLTGNGQLWEQMGEATARQILEIVSGVRGAENTPRVLTLRIFDGKLKAYGNASHIGAMVRELGGVNVVETDPVHGATDGVEISLEDIYALDPDVILLAEHGGPGQVRADLEAAYGDHPVWLSLRAVRQGRVYDMEAGLYHQMPNSRFWEAYYNLAQLLYPERHISA